MKSKEKITNCKSAENREKDLKLLSIASRKDALMPVTPR